MISVNSGDLNGCLTYHIYMTLLVKMYVVNVFEKLWRVQSFPKVVLKGDK